MYPSQSQQDTFLRGIMTGESPMPLNDVNRSIAGGFGLPVPLSLRDPQSLRDPYSSSPSFAAPGPSVAESAASRYTFQGQTFNGYNHIVASDFRNQVQNAPQPSRGIRYPSAYADYEGHASHLSRPFVHYPVLPGQSTPYNGNVDRPGAVRGIYNNGNRTEALCAFHNTNVGTTRGGFGAMTPATYHPAVHRG